MLVERATTALVEPAAIANEDVATTVAAAPPLVCLSHLRWDFVRQRPQHLMSRFAQRAPVWFWEEHIACDHPLPFLEHHYFPADKLTVLRPRVPQGAIGEPLRVMLRDLYRQFVKTALRADPVLWYYTPMMLGFTADEPAAAVVYDCMDELSAFAHADPALLANEAALLKRADVVFTGGRSLYEAKRSRHNNVHAFPSSVDTAHFGTARTLPVAQRRAPVLGYFGVIDERLDLSLIAALAAARPDWRIEMVGPVVKIDPASVPKAANIVWLGSRDYAALPQVLAGWDVALMPFAINEATRFISPTKTPE
jgi:UDP-galactopyranose mutase